MKQVKHYLIVMSIIVISNNVTNVSAQLPNFRIARIDSTYFGVKNINKALPVLFMYFSPTCSDCGEMTSAILLHIKDLKNIQIVMITNESLIEVRKFIMYYGLYKYKNITVGTEGYTYEFLQNFQVGKLPFLVFYNNKDKLIMKYNGTIPAKNFILNVVKDCNY